MSFDAPDTVKRAMHQAIDDNRSHYVQTTGIPQCLISLVAKLRSGQRHSCRRTDEVMVTTGASTRSTSRQALLEPGDEVIVPDPSGRPAWKCQSRSGDSRRLPAARRPGWRYDLEELKATISLTGRGRSTSILRTTDRVALTREDITAIANLCRSQSLADLGRGLRGRRLDDAQHVARRRFRDG